MTSTIFAATLMTDEAAGATWQPAIAFPNWSPMLQIATAGEAGSDVEIENPDYEEDAAMALQGHDAQRLFQDLGIEITEDGCGWLEIQALFRSAMRMQNRGALGALRHDLEQLMRIARKGQMRGATHIVVC